MTNACFCPLHSLLRIFGDSFLDHVAELANRAGKLEGWVECVRAKLDNDYFDAEDDDGYIKTTALQGPQCKKLLGISGDQPDIDGFAELIDAAGIEDGGQDVVDCPEEADLAKKCRSLMPDGTRCTGRHAGARRVQCEECIALETNNAMKRSRVSPISYNPCMVALNGR